MKLTGLQFTKDLDTDKWSDNTFKMMIQKCNIMINSKIPAQQKHKSDALRVLEFIRENFPERMI